MDLIDIILAKKLATSDPCISISDISQTESSTESGGKNTLTVTLTNGATSKFNFYNGETGQSGVYIGNDKPTDSNINVWINPNNNPDTINPECLPMATSTSLGCIKIGYGLTIDNNGVLSLSIPNASGVIF